jgi:hypothetical protein
MHSNNTALVKSHKNPPVPNKTPSSPGISWATVLTRVPKKTSRAPGISWATVLTNVREITPFKHNIPEHIFKGMVEKIVSNNSWSDMTDFEEEYNVDLMDYMI